MRNQPHAFLILCVLWKIEVIIILLFCCMVELGRLGSTLLFLILNRMWCWTKNVHPNGHSLIWTNFYPYLPFLSLLIALSLMRWKTHVLTAKERYTTPWSASAGFWNELQMKLRDENWIYSDHTYLLGKAHTLWPYVVHWYSIQYTYKYEKNSAHQNFQYQRNIEVKSIEKYMMISPVLMLTWHS